jgi:hypothetical protein
MSEALWQRFYILSYCKCSGRYLAELWMGSSRVPIPKVATVLGSISTVESDGLQYIKKMKKIPLFTVDHQSLLGLHAIDYIYL